MNELAFHIPKTDFHKWIRNQFPGLAPAQYKLTSQISGDYNCIGWAADDTDRWWWPSEDGYWPDVLPLVNTLENFVNAFRLLGYSPCDTADLETGYEKVVIYRGADGSIKHMAKQLESGRWSSKLGQVWDIEHSTPAELIGENYGWPVQYLRRPIHNAQKNTIGNGA
jgi:hypothetical protein